MYFVFAPIQNVCSYLISSIRLSSGCSNLCFTSLPDGITFCGMNSVTELNCKNLVMVSTADLTCTGLFHLGRLSLVCVLSSGGPGSVSAGTGQASSWKSGSGSPASPDARRVPCESATCHVQSRIRPGSAGPSKMVSKAGSAGPSKMASQ